jgi:hypothetical protein
MEKKKGMLFGKLNIIDLAILLVLIAAVAFFVTHFMNTGETTSATQKVYITFYEEECANYVVEQTHVGDPVLDGSLHKSLGTVVDVQTGEAHSYTTNPNTGKLTMGPKEDYCSVYITIEAQGELTGNGVVIDETLYGVGHSLVLHAGEGKYYLVVYNIEPAN